MSRQLAAAGAAVAIGFGHHGDAARDTAVQIVSAGGRAAAVGADLEHPSGPGDLVSAAENAIGPVDVLVSNAGMGGTKTLAEGTAAFAWACCTAAGCAVVAPLVLGLLRASPSGWRAGFAVPACAFAALYLAYRSLARPGPADRAGPAAPAGPRAKAGVPGGVSPGACPWCAGCSPG